MSFALYLKSRPLVLRVAAVLLAVLIIVGCAVGITTIESGFKSAYSTQQYQLKTFLGAWQSAIDARLVAGISVANAAMTFATAAATAPANLSAPAANRTVVLEPERWTAAMQSVFQEVPGIYTVVLQSGGVNSQDYPPGTALLGFDVISAPSTSFLFTLMMASKAPVVVGPLPLPVGPYGMAVSAPVYLWPNKSDASFWGGVSVAFVISDMLAAMNMSQNVTASGYECVVYAQSLTNASAPPVLLVATAPSLTIEGLRSAGGMTAQVNTQDDTNGLYVSMIPAGGLLPAQPPTWMLATVVLGVVVASSLVAAAAVGVVWLAFHRRHARAPHRSAVPVATAVMLLGLKNIETLRECVEPAAFAHAKDAFLANLERHASRHGCYVSGQIVEGCYVIVGTKPAGLLEVALSAVAIDIGKMAVRARARGSKEGHGDTCTQRNSSPGSEVTRTVTQRASTDGGVESQPTAGKATRWMTVELAATLHHGPLRSAYQSSLDLYEFRGPGLTELARAFDETRAAEVTATPQWREACEGTVPCATQRTENDVRLYVLQAADDNNEDGRGGSGVKPHREPTTLITATVAATMGVVTKQRAAVVVVTLGEGNDDANLVADICTAVDVAKGTGAHVLSVLGRRMVFAYVGIGSAVRRGAELPGVIRGVLQEKRQDTTVVAAMSVGTTFVGISATGIPAVSGAVLDRAVGLMHATNNAAARDAGLRDAELVVDDAAAKELEHHFELQCVGTLGIPNGKPCFAVMRAWPDDDCGGGEEWLYTLQLMEQQSRYTTLNRIFALHAAGDTAAARALLGAFDESGEAARIPSLSSSAIAELRDQVCHSGLPTAPSPTGGGGG